jgi:3'(2'), 5'-bisphosphate nucleotidase
VRSGWRRADVIALDDGLVGEILSLARDAGEAIMSYYDRDSGAVLKADQSPLTLADRASHDLIVARLAQLDPAVPIISEESAAAPFDERREWRRFWMVDPLDGTKEFLNRNGDFTVNIALIEDGVPILGVVHAPAIGTAYHALANAHAGRIDANGSSDVHASDYRAQGLRVVASRSHAGAAMPKLLERLGNPPCVSKGSSLKFCLVAEGTANFYPRLGPTMEWDVAAAHCIVTAAGGSITDTSGRTLRYNKPDLRNPHLVTCGEPPYPWQPMFEGLEAD